MENLTNESNPTNLELLRLARDLAYSDYNNRKADIHNKWISESAQVWKNQRQRLAYPPIPAYPSEEEIVSRALKLVAFLNTPRQDIEYQTRPVPVPKVEKEVEVEEIEELPVSIAYAVAPVVEESSEKMLSSMMRKFENLFNKGEKK